MKFENFEKCQSIVKQINKHQSDLDAMETSFISVSIANARERVFDIPASRVYDHSYSELANEFCEKVRDDLRVKIATLKANLLEL